MEERTYSLEELTDLLLEEELALHELLLVRRFSYASNENRRAVEEAAVKLEKKVDDDATRIRLGAFKYTLKNFDGTIEILSGVKTIEAEYFKSRAHLDSGDLAASEKALQSATARHTSTFLFADLLLTLYEDTGRYAEAGALLKATRKGFEQASAYQFHVGRQYEWHGEHADAVAAYEKAAELDPENVQALFHLAYNYDRKGRDEEAIELYERCLALPPVYENALLNLGVLLEDHDMYDKAVNCYRMILSQNPNHERAREYLKDSASSLTMVIDEDQEREEDEQKAILHIPVTDFELSVRSRNCLRNMNIRVLGDLIKKTEAELLAFKNFGETSLTEIKYILVQKGLRLGQAKEEEERMRREEQMRQFLEDGNQEILMKAITDLDLSVRSRKCLEKLNIKALGDLINKTEPELLLVRNFGLSSLNEIKQKLTEYGLTLKEVATI